MFPESTIRDVVEAFDSVASDFETSFENEVTKRIRGTLYSTIRALVAPGSALLDINCGVGIDAVTLSTLGYRVTGVDISENMLEQARLRAQRNGTGSIEFLQSSYEDLSALNDRTYDLVVSNFGGLNCSDALEKACRAAAGATGPGGHFVAVLMPRVCIWEIMAGVARLNIDAAFRRFRETTYATGFGKHAFRVHYHPFGNFVRAASPWFDIVSCRGLCVLSPPPHATKFRSSFPSLSGILLSLDKVAGRIPLLRVAGDHYMAVLRKKPS